MSSGELLTRAPVSTLNLPPNTTFLQNSATPVQICLNLPQNSPATSAGPLSARDAGSNLRYRGGRFPSLHFAIFGCA